MALPSTTAVSTSPGTSTPSVQLKPLFVSGVPSYFLLPLAAVTVMVFSEMGEMVRVPSATVNTTFVKFLLVFAKSPETMPTGYLPTSVPFAVHAAVCVSATFFFTS